MKLNKLLTIIFTSKYVLNLLGFLMLAYFIWYRFLRERVPKNIPFGLTELGLYILISICCIYVYILFRLIKPKEPSELIRQLLQPLSKFYTPWFVLEETIKTNKYIRKIYPEILIYFPRVLRYYKTVSIMYKVYLVLYIIPRTLLLIIFCIDVFYFHRIEYVYTFSFLILYILICRYIIYSLKKTTEECITALDEWYFVEITSQDTEDSDYFVDIDSIDWYTTAKSYIEWKYLSDKEHRLEIKKFIDLQSAAINFDNTLYSYISSPKYKLIEKYAIENNLTVSYVQSKLEELDPLISKDFYELIPIVIHLYLAVDNYEYTSNSDNRVKRFNLILITTYLICWIYILFVSFKIELLNTLLNILDKIEPFSGLFL